jgi:hypothetical protein
MSRVGAPFDGKVREGVVYRLQRAPPAPVKYPYLIVSNNIDDSHADVIMLTNFRNAKDRLKKKVRKGMGLEVTIAQARKMDGAGAARWLADIRDLQEFCHLARCQLVLSSGAKSANEMVSSLCLDAILRVCGIEPQRHWHDMNRWLDARLSRRVVV